MFGQTFVRNDNDVFIQIFHEKKFFAPINFQVFLKHLPSHKEFIGMLGDQIRPWEVLEKSGPTDKQTYTRTSANYYMDYGSHCRSSIRGVLEGL